MDIRFFPRLAAAGVAIVLGLAALPALAAETVGVRVFVLKYRRAEEATVLVRPLLSESGSILLQSRANALTVTDGPAQLNLVARALSRFDTPPRDFSIVVKMLRARSEAAPGDPGVYPGPLGGKLREVFRFTDYSLLDSAVLSGVEGGNVSSLLGGEYRLGFHIDPAAGSSSLRLSQFSLFREKADESGRVQPTPLYRTTLTINLNQTLIVGAAKDEASRRALILVLVAQEVPKSADRGAARPSGPTAAEGPH